MTFPHQRRRAKWLLTEEMAAQIPRLYDQYDDGEEAVAYAKFFTPDAAWRWYVTEFDGDDIFFGLQVKDRLQLGYFSLSGLGDLHGPWGLSVEHDLCFRPTPLEDILEEYGLDGLADLA